MELGAFSVSLSVKDIEASKVLLREIRLSGFRWGRDSKLADYEEWRSHHWPVSGNVREKYHDLQSWLGPRCSDA